MNVVITDGGRKAAGFRSSSTDCAVRALAIAAEMPYQGAVDLVNEWGAKEQTIRGTWGARARAGKGSSPKNGVYMFTMMRLMKSLGWTWTPTMGIGTGCQVHLRKDELPAGRLVVRLSGHYAAVVDGVIHDTHDCSREGTRCVYGYWRKA